MISTAPVQPLHEYIGRAPTTANPTGVNDEDHLRRLANQRLFRRYYVECSCERGCHVCAHTGLVTKGHAKQTTPS